MSYNITHIITNRQEAIAYNAKKKLSCIESDLTICKMNMAGIVDKANCLLDDKEYRASLTEDQIIYLEALRIRYMREMDLTDNAQKGI